MTDAAEASANARWRAKKTVQGRNYEGGATWCILQMEPFFSGLSPIGQVAVISANII